MGHGGHSHHHLNRRAVLLPILLSIGLVALKIYGWNETDSVSLLSSLLDSAMDILVSSLNLAAIIYAAKPADDDHRHGHNSIEDIVGLVQASFIAASAIFLLYEAGNRFLNPSTVQNPETGVGVLAISMAAPLVIVTYQRLVLRKTKSVVLEADSLHYLSDLLMNGLIMVSLWVASRPQYGWVDPVFAVLIAGYIFYSSLKIGTRAFNHLMDKELPEEQLQQITEIIETHEGSLGYHALKTRRSGSKVFIQLHIEVDDALNIKQAHQIADGLEQKLEHAFEDTAVIVHIDPKSLANET